MKSIRIGALGLIGLWMLAGCITPQQGVKIAPKNQLLQRAEVFNKLVRWKAFQRAKLLVMPRLRASVMLQWEKERPHLRITGYQVRDITETTKGKKAIVLVVIQRHRLPSVTLKRVVEQQRWESKDGFWYFVGVKGDASPARRSLAPPKSGPALSKSSGAPKKR